MDGHVSSRASWSAGVLERRGSEAMQPALRSTAPSVVLLAQTIVREEPAASESLHLLTWLHAPSHPSRPFPVTATTTTTIAADSLGSGVRSLKFSCVVDQSGQSQSLILVDCSTLLPIALGHDPASGPLPPLFPLLPRFTRARHAFFAPPRCPAAVCIS